MSTSSSGCEGPFDNILNDVKYADLLRRIAAGHFISIIAAPSSLWESDDVKSLLARHHFGCSTFAQCMFSGEFQKYTTFAFSPAFGPALAALDGLKCNHPIGRSR